MQVQRRSYPKSFKAQVVDECTQRGSTVAGVAWNRGLNTIAQVDSSPARTASRFTIHFRSEASPPEPTGHPKHSLYDHPDPPSSGYQALVHVDILATMYKKGLPLLRRLRRSALFEHQLRLERWIAGGRLRARRGWGGGQGRGWWCDHSRSAIHEGENCNPQRRGTEHS